MGLTLALLEQFYAQTFSPTRIHHPLIQYAGSLNHRLQQQQPGFQNSLLLSLNGIVPLLLLMIQPLIHNESQSNVVDIPQVKHLIHLEILTTLGKFSPSQLS